MTYAAVLLLFALQASATNGSLDVANALYRKGDFESAAKIYRSIVQQDPKNEKAQTGLLRSLLRNEDLEGAHVSAQEAQKALPTNSSVLSAMGDIYFRIGSLSKASDLYLRAIDADSRNGRAYLGMAKLYHSDFQRRSARLMARKAYVNDPLDPEIILTYATDLPAVEQIPLLEKYLELGLNEPQIHRDGASEAIAYLKVMGDRQTWLLTKDPSPATFELKQIASSSGRSSGYRVKVSFNGQKPVDLQLDTGARGLMIHRKLAKQLGVKIISQSSVRGLGDEGERKSFIGLADSVRVGDVEFRDCVIHISDKRLLQNAQGLIGSDVFEQFLISLDLPGLSVRLQPLPVIEGRRYDDPKSWEELDRHSIPDLSEFMRVRRWSHLLLDTLVNKKVRGYFYLDTGAGANFISVDLARKVTSLQTADATIRGISGNVKNVSVARNVLLQAGGFLQQNDGMWAISFKELSKNIGLEISGLLGHPILSQLIIVIDYRDGLLNLVYPHKKN